MSDNEPIFDALTLATLPPKSPVALRLISGECNVLEWRHAECLMYSVTRWGMVRRQLTERGALVVSAEAQPPKFLGCARCGGELIWAKESQTF